MNAANSPLWCAHCFERSVVHGRCSRAQCAQPMFDHRAHDALAPGLVLKGSYRMGKVLGAGGYGITYLGRHVELNKFYAIKELFPGGDRPLVRRDAQGGAAVRAVSAGAARIFDTLRGDFLREARVLADIDGERNPEIVKVYDFFEENGTAYIVMPYLQGHTLADQVMRHGALEQADAVHVLRMMLRALRVVHRAGMLHQDIKPENVYLVDGRQPVLIDFGNARGAEPGADGLRPQAGTPGYAPPEQRSGTMKESGDLYALGATMYAVLTAQCPPDAAQRLAGTPLQPSLQSLARHVPPLLLAFIDKAMRLRVEERFASVDEALALLKPLLEPRLDWIALLKDGALRRHLQGMQRHLEGGKACALQWNWRPALLSYFWFLALRCLPAGLACAALEALCATGALFSQELRWPWLLPVLASRLGQGLLGDWLVHRDLERHVRQLRAGPKPVTAAGVGHALQQRVRLQPSMVALGVGCGPLAVAAAALLAWQQQEAIRLTVSDDLQVTPLLCEMQRRIAADHVAPSKESLGVKLQDLGGIADFELQEAHVVLTLKQPAAVAMHKVRLEFDKVAGEYMRCVNIDVPQAYAPRRCTNGTVQRQVQCS